MIPEQPEQFSVVAAALVDSFSACVSCGSGADLVRTTLLWAEQHCSLVEMRPGEQLYLHFYQRLIIVLEFDSWTKLTLHWIK